MTSKESSTLLRQRPPTDAAPATPVDGFRTVVVGVDFTPASLRAARWVGMQLAPDATLVLVHVAAQPALPVYVRTTARPPSARDVDDGEALRGGLLGLADTLGRERTRVVIRSGTVARVLAQVADEAGADLLCIGRSPRSRDGARFRDATQLRLLAWTRTPMLVVPTIDLGPTGSIVAGLDDRHGSQRVLDIASMLARRIDVRVDAVHVIEPELRHFVGASPGSGMSPAHADSSADSWLDERARRWAERCIERTRHAERLTAVIATGDPGEQLSRHARKRRAGLIVVGHGGADRVDTPAGSHVAGSSTRLLVRVSPCPVLVVPLVAPAAMLPSVPIDQTRAPRRRAHAHAYAHPRTERTTAVTSTTLPTRVLHAERN